MDSNTNLIEPTIGRVVHFRPNGLEGRYHDDYGRTIQVQDEATPMTGLICYVHDSRLVNLSVFDHHGRQHDLPGMVLRQPDDPEPAAPTPYCEWMPYQVKGKTTGSESGEKSAGQQNI